MALSFNTKELAELMQHFYTLTGIRIVLFDEEYQEIFAYPEECLPFCLQMRKNPQFFKLCCESDQNSFKTCKKTGKLVLYHCHANLIEATAPIINNGAIIGYIMFGQVSGSKEKEEFRTQLLALAKNYGDCTEELVRKVKFKNEKQLIAASKILEACTSYILLKEIIKPSRVERFSAIDAYISEHLAENITVSSICKQFYISRTQLYALCKRYIPTGIAAHIKTKRLIRAKELLQTTDMTVTEIAKAVGFSDYNYFLKSFKKHFGVHTKSVRKY